MKPGYCYDPNQPWQTGDIPACYDFLHEILQPVDPAYAYSSAISYITSLAQVCGAFTPQDFANAVGAYTNFSSQNVNVHNVTCGSVLAGWSCTGSSVAAADQNCQNINSALQDPTSQLSRALRPTQAYGLIPSPLPGSSGSDAGLWGLMGLIPLVLICAGATYCYCTRRKTSQYAHVRQAEVARAEAAEAAQNTRVHASSGFMAPQGQALALPHQDEALNLRDQMAQHL